MTSIRQRRRNRHKIKDIQRQQARIPLYLTLNLDVSKVNEAFAHVRNTLAKLSEVMAQPEFQEMARNAFQSIVNGLSPRVIRGMISVQRTVFQLDDEICLGNSSCRFNARSPILQCAVNPSGNCNDCRFYEPHEKFFMR